MKKTVTILTVLMYALTACSPNADGPVSSDSSYPNASYPNPSYPNPAGQNDYTPKPSDVNLIRGEVFLNAKDLLTLESFPLQFMLHLTGDMPTPCNKLRVAVSLPDAENKIHVDVYSVFKADEICVQALEPFDVNIPLGSFASGKYSLWVNGEMIAEFQS